MLQMTPDRNRARGIEAIECLIENDQLRVAQQRQQTAQFLARAERADIDELVEIPVEVELLGELEHCGVGALEFLRVRVDLQALPSRQESGELFRRTRISQLALGRDGFCPDRMATDQDLARARLQ